MKTLKREEAPVLFAKSRIAKETIILKFRMMIKRTKSIDNSHFSQRNKTRSILLQQSLISRTPVSITHLIITMKIPY